MENRRTNEKNRIRTIIKDITCFINTDKSTIIRFKSLPQTDFNIKQIDKLTAKNQERDDTIQELTERLEQVERGELDSELEGEYLLMVEEIRKKDNEHKIKKQQESEHLKERSEISKKFYKNEKTGDRQHRYTEKDIDRSMGYFERACDSLPDYIKNNIKDMPNNKAYLWRDVYFFGERDEEPGEPVIIFEKRNGNMMITEWHKYETLVYEKRGQGRKTLISRETKVPR